jgi:acyl carrier protein
MNHQEIIREFIIREIAWEKELDNFGYDFNLLENGIIDSIAMIKIIDYIEDKFSIKLGEQDLTPENFDSINSILRMVLKNIKTNSINI